MKTKNLFRNCAIFSILLVLLTVGGCNKEADPVGLYYSEPVSITDEEGVSFKFEMYPFYLTLFPSFEGQYTVTAEGFQDTKGKLSETENWDIQTIQRLSDSQPYDITNTEFLNQMGISSITKSSPDSWTIQFLPFSGTQPQNIYLRGTIRYKGTDNMEWENAWVRYPKGSLADQCYSGKISIEDFLIELPNETY